MNLQLSVFVLAMEDYLKDIEGREGELVGEIIFIVVVIYLLYRIVKKFRSKGVKQSS